MILILDDTFVDRHKYHDISYLKEERYAAICSVRTQVKSNDLYNLVNVELRDVNVVCNHKTLQMYNPDLHPLSNEQNLKLRENLLNKVDSQEIERIEFSGGLDNDITNHKIDKDLFYDNLRAFIDDYIETKVPRTKILYYGEKYQKEEFVNTVQQLMMEIRRAGNNKDLGNSNIVRDGISKLYEVDTDDVLNRWKEMSEKEIIAEINAKL